MRCDRVLELLPRLAHDRLPLDDRALVRGHLEGCPACAGEEAAQARTDALLDAAFTDHPFDDAWVEGLVQRLRPAAHAARPGGVQAAPHRGLGAATAAALVAVALGAFALAERPDGRLAAGPERGAVGAVLAHAGGGLLLLDEVTGARPLGAGVPIRAGQRLVAVDAAAAPLILEDGTRVLLHPDTEVSLRADADGGLTVALAPEGEGEVYLEVARRTRPLRVAARDVTAEVLGTRFLVHQGHRTTRVVVVEGRVGVTASADRRVLIAGQAAERGADGRLLALEVTAPLYGRWVPRLREELAAREAAARPAPVPPAAGGAGPAAEPDPLGPLPPPPAPDPDLDAPIEPPGRGGPR